MARALIFALIHVLASGYAPPEETCNATSDQQSMLSLGAKKKAPCLHPEKDWVEDWLLFHPVSATSPAWNQQEQTSVTHSLNEQISADFAKGVFQGGKGVLVRNLNDGFQFNSFFEVVPATFWSNDLFAPSQIYPNGDPFIASDFAKAVVGVVVGDAMDKLIYEYDKIQDDDWGWGVNYPADSNAADKRCRWLGSESKYSCNQDGVAGTFQCQSDGSQCGPFVQDATAKGAGQFPAGNPYANAQWGGGTGCHWDKDKTVLNQQDARVGNVGLSSDPDCQCNYEFVHSASCAPLNKDYSQNCWYKWIKQWVQVHGTQPVWYRDLAGCWMNNFRDMINLQNWFWWLRTDWNDFTVPPNSKPGTPAASQRPTWGWNEIPVNRNDIGNYENFQAVLMVLPSAICGGDGSNDVPDCLSNEAKQDMENQLDWYRGNNPSSYAFMTIGPDDAGKRPGSYVVFARQVLNSDGSGNWYREFFCTNYEFNKYKVVFIQQTAGDNGVCYLACKNDQPTC